MEVDLASRPQLPTSEDQKRAEHQGLRSRLLCGRWDQDLERALSKHISPDRRTAWGIPEMSRNPFRSLSTQVGGALYASPPNAKGDAALLAHVERAGFWQLMQRVSTDLVGLREKPVRADYSERSGVFYRPLEPELCHIRSLPETPDVPTAIEEIQCRMDPDTGKPCWAWEILDVEDLDNPRHMILSADRQKDWTKEFLGKPASGGDYRYRDILDDGRPFIPVTLYHAERTGRLWDSYYGLEAVLGTLTVGVLLTFWVHGVKDGSFATVLLVAGKVVGVEIRSPSGERTQVISAEPGSLIEIAPMEEGVQPSAVQLAPGFKPQELMEAIGMFEQGLAEYAGVSAADLVRTGADPRSGVSLSVSREGLRTAQARFEPQLRRGDLEVIANTARVLNAATGTRHATDGYSISYPALPLSSAETAALREDLVAKVREGLMSKVDAYMRLHPGIAREQAIQELQRIQRENALFPSASAPLFAA